MKRLLTLLFLSTLGWHLFAQENASTEAIKLLSNKNISKDSLNDLTERMLGFGNPYAVIYLIDDSSNVNLQRAKMMLADEAYDSSTIDSISNNWSQWESVLKKIKKPKAKAAAIDSLYQLSVSSFDEFVAKGRALQGIQRYLKKNQLQEYYQTKLLSIENAFERKVWLNESQDAAIKVKNKKWSLELGSIEAREDSIYISNRESFVTALIQSISDQSSNTPVASEKPLEKPDNQIWWTITGGLVVLIIAITVVMIISINKWKQKNLVLEEKVLGSQNELTDQIQSLQMLHEQSAAALQMMKAEIQQREAQLSQLKRDHTLKEQKVSEELSVLQNEARQLVDELSKESSVQKWMELQNILSRKINQIKELL